MYIIAKAFKCFASENFHLRFFPIYNLKLINCHFHTFPIAWRSNFHRHQIRISWK